MRYKMLATDLDDSLLDNNFKISAGDREAIARAIGTGVKVVLATGRMYRSALPYCRELQLDTPLITYQGAFVKIPGTGEVLYNRPVPLDTALELLEKLEPRGYHTNIYLDDQLLVDKITEESRIYQSISGIEPTPVGNLVKYLSDQRREPTKILVVSSEENIDWLGKETKGYFGDSLYITESKPVFLEFMHPEATKGRALEAVASYYGIDSGDIIAVGDGYNDMDMILYAGLGVAVANAREDLKRRADFVTNSNTGGGLSRVIGKFIFGEED